ncbi:MAG: hypothetical protein ACK4ZU_05880 [Allorhizobium sp.]
MDWKGMCEEAVEIFGQDIAKSLARFGSAILPILLLPLLLLGYFGLKHLYVTAALAGILMICIIWLRLRLATRYNPGRTFILAFEAIIWAGALYGTGWVAGHLLFTVAGWQA